MRPKLHCHVFPLILCTVCVLPCHATEPVLASVDRRTQILLNRVLHSKEGHTIKPIMVVYVTPYVRPTPLPTKKPHTRVHAEIVYLLTASDMFYCFYLWPSSAKYAWSAPLVSLHDKNAMEPIGSLGKLLAKSGKAIPNSVSAGAGMGSSFLANIDLRQPLIVYRLVKGKLVRAVE